MRRKDREIREMQEILEVIDLCDTIRVAFSDGQGPYIVPLSFGYTYEQDTLTFYFHSAGVGRKVDFLKSGQTVGFELDCCREVTEADKACGFSMLFRSVIGTGTPCEIIGKEEKLSALKHLMSHYCDRGDLFFDDRMLDIVSVFAVKTETISGKKHLQGM